MSDVTFAVQTVQASVVGNLGAPLRTGGEVADDDSEEVYFSKNPFKFGLVEEAEVEEGSEGEEGVGMDVVERGHDHEEDRDRVVDVEV